MELCIQVSIGEQKSFEHKYNCAFLYKLNQFMKAAQNKEIIDWPLAQLQWH